jgi:hypothetical protein
MAASEVLTTENNAGAVSHNQEHWHAMKSNFSAQVASKSNDTTKFSMRLTRMIHNGKSTLKNGLMSIWKPISTGNGNSSLFGNSKAASVQFATRKSPRLQDGTAIISFGEAREAAMDKRIGCYFTQNAIGKSIVSD